MPTPAGRKRFRISVERIRPQSVGRLGEQKQAPKNWQEWKRVWASIEALSAREIVQSDRAQSVISFRIVITALPGLTERDRIRWKGGVLNIVSIQPRGYRQEDQELLCTQEKD